MYTFTNSSAEEAYTYPNASYITDKIIEAAKKVTKRGGLPLSSGERAWNDQFNANDAQREESLPVLKAVVVDFISVNHFDSTGLQVKFSNLLFNNNDKPNSKIGINGSKSNIR